MKSTAGFVLGLIGGIGSALWGIIALIGAMLTTTALVAFQIPGFGALSSLRFVTPIIMLVGGGLAIWGALLMHKDDNAQVKKGGILALIGGIIGFNILSLIGGILGLVSSGKTSTGAVPKVQSAPKAE